MSNTTDSSPSLRASRESADDISTIGAAFMIDMDAYAAAASVGYEGLAFYVGGRGGVLGEVSADDVLDAFCVFPPATVEAGWAQAAMVESRHEAAVRFAAAAGTWAGTHLPADGIDYGRMAALAGTVIAQADADGAPVFEGWRALDEPGSARELAVHRINALRELRFARHVAALRASDLEPLVAFMIKTPYMADIFGWPEPRPIPTDEDKQAWAAVESATDQAFAADLAVLEPEELNEFVALLASIRAAMT
ncbi:MAG: hypothetical protein KDB24_10750 [Microthrixaceae bacterium]|nr:hypothetical protein [Microthrixaceae bacterium]